ncbi:digestive cysteine proteinase 2-like [Symsagittifera roscoffensis]|uniref:digestive cysteine proteinase 2-like n=1 Tax=Symsagittifera roscoffensis TaxID=84072 RepID=UPI00307B56BA
MNDTHVSGITERRGTCKDEGKEKVVKVSHHVQLPRGNENLLKETVATVGPCSIAIDASHSSFQLYKDGIYDPAACSQYSLDHAVLVVGYGGSGNEEFWWVKNSWGKSWGLSGYIKMARNKNNKCGVASEAIYPVVA